MPAIDAAAARHGTRRLALPRLRSRGIDGAASTAPRAAPRAATPRDDAKRGLDALPGVPLEETEEGVDRFPRTGIRWRRLGGRLVYRLERLVSLCARAPTRPSRGGLLLSSSEHCSRSRSSIGDSCTTKSAARTPPVSAPGMLCRGRRRTGRGDAVCERGGGFVRAPVDSSGGPSLKSRPSTTQFWPRRTL